MQAQLEQCVIGKADCSNMLCGDLTLPTSSIYYTIVEGVGGFLYIHRACQEI